MIVCMPTFATSQQDALGLSGPNTQHQTLIKSPIGQLLLTANDLGIIQVEFVTTETQAQHTHFSASRHPMLVMARTQLAQWFDNPAHDLTVPLAPVGTPLQKTIWAALLRIPVGKTLTYQQLAIKIGTSPRVIGNACRHNPLPIIVPCHRILAKNHLGGYAGQVSGT